MATIRAKRMERYLNDIGWETQSGRWTCRAKNCRFFSFNQQNFCSDCGAKMPTKCDPTDTAEQLEAAIAFALKESR